jgi:hypothetical protein
VLFHDGLSSYEPQEFETHQFSDDLVALHAKPMPGAPRARQIFQGSRRFTMLSEGEALSFRILSGAIRHYRDRRPTEWRVETNTGEFVANGKLPLDGEWHPIEVAVPETGRYALQVDDFGAGWHIDYAPGTPAVWPVVKGRSIYPLGGPTTAQYFYVPEGTDRIAYYVKGSAHSVLDGDGDVVAEIAAQPGDVVTVDVPEGQGGRVWCLRELKSTGLWFYNCPNWLAALAEDMMVPREVAPQ